MVEWWQKKNRNDRKKVNKGKSKKESVFKMVQNNSCLCDFENEMKDEGV